MKNYKLLTVSGISIFANWTLMLLFVGLFLFYLWQGATVGAALAGVTLVGTLFGCVVLHELGHAFMARRFGIKTVDITMYPIGGVARLERMPKEPKQELLIAIAGPAVNLVIAIALFWINTATGRPVLLENTLAAFPNNVLSLLMWMNLALVGFNMLPAFPMDGGRVLRAGLATVMPFYRATHIAAFVGQVMAVLFIFVGPFWNPMLIFVGIFVFIGARQEAKHATEM